MVKLTSLFGVHVQLLHLGGPHLAAVAGIVHREDLWQCAAMS